jgi:hypothetical protein
MLKKPISLSPFPRLTVKRCDPSGIPAGKNRMTWVSVAEMTDIRYISHQTCGGCDPKFSP